MGVDGVGWEGEAGVRAEGLPINNSFHLPSEYHLLYLISSSDPAFEEKVREAT